MGSALYATLYNHYLVVGTKMTVSIAGAAVNEAVAGIYVADDTTIPYTVWTSYREAKRGVQRTLTNMRNTVTMSSGFSAKKFFNVTDVKDNITRLGALQGANPVEEAFFVIYYQDLSGGTSAKRMVITMDFAVSYSEPKDILPST